jgi:hypothetical protein
MKILFVGVFATGSTNIGQADGFSLLGHEVERYDYRAKLRTYHTVAARDEDLKAFIRSWRPDLTVFSKCNQMHVDCVRTANEVGQSCLWFMDPKNANFNEELHHKIRSASFSCFGQVPLFEVYKVCSHARAFFVSEGYDEDVDFPEAGIDPIHDLSFIGSIRDQRRKLLHDKIGFHVYARSFGEGHRKAVAETKVNLNLTYSEGGTSDRVHKIMAAGGFVLSQPWHGMENMFSVGDHLAIFETPQELLYEAAYYLEHEEERLEIARKGREKNQPYSRTGWAQFLIDKMTKS